jgi:hypothetical protein
MNRSEHRREAERLLAEAGREQDSIRRGLILAEAQIHAILALSAAAGVDPPGPGRPESRIGAGLTPGEIQPASRRFRPTYPRGHPLYTSPTRADADEPARPAATPPVAGQPAPAAPAPPGQPQPPPYTPGVRPRTRRPAEPGDADDEEPDAAKQPPAPGNPGGPKPWRLTL